MRAARAKETLRPRRRLCLAHSAMESGVGTRLQALRSRLPRLRRSRRGDLLVMAGVALAGAAAIVQRQAREAEVGHPARGRFVSEGGARLHFIAQGKGRPVVFLHGNGAMVEDLLISGVIDQTSRQYRAI